MLRFCATERQIIVFRHGKDQRPSQRGYTCWSPDALLSEDGKQQMKETAHRNRNLLVGCTVFATSPLIRAQQSLFTMMDEIAYDGRPQLYDMVQFLPGLMTRDPSLWYAENTSGTVSDVWKRDPKRVEAEGRYVFNGVLNLARALPPAGKALCVSHGGPLDAGFAEARCAIGLRDASYGCIEDLAKGEGIVFIFNDNTDDNLGLLCIEELRI